MPAKPLILYSMNTWLAYKIAEVYYGDLHYVWCTPDFDPVTVKRHSAVPPSSSPHELYWSLFEDLKRRESHSTHVEQNRAGILRGAAAKRAAGAITADQEQEIVTVVGLAKLGDFRPLIYVIPYAPVEDLIKDPPPEDKAHPLSAEFIIDALPRDAFDLIELRGER
jgi:hypothetical protein